MTTNATAAEEAAVGSGELSRDDVFEVLGNSRRRRMLRFLDSVDGPVSVRELVTDVAADEEGVSRQALSQEQYKRVHVASLQTHLPKLDSVGVIHYDRDERTVELTEAASTLLPHLEFDGLHNWVPVDVFESPAGVTVVADLPGFDRSDVQIEANERSLSVAASRATDGDGDEEPVRQERPASVERTISLPAAVVVDDPTVSFDDGVLTLEFSKHVSDRSVVIDL